MADAPEPAKGFASVSNQSGLSRRLSSWVMRQVLSPRTRERKRRRAEARRVRAGDPHRIEYFHQVDDPYSHLAVQTLVRLGEAYDVEIVPQLAAREAGTNEPEPELLRHYARRDAADVAAGYGLSFPAKPAEPTPEAIRLAERVLAASDPRDFADRAVLVGAALWADEKDELARLAHDLPSSDEATAVRRAEEGRARRTRLGHYSGGTFHYAGEWYWGVDRLCHLEARLAGLGARREGAEPVATRPAIDTGGIREARQVRLTFFPSLRSPYTAIAFDRTVALARETGVTLAIRPVLPMVMRGVPVTLTKGRYIMSDTIREGELAGVAFGNMVDPIGRPVELGFSLLAFAREQGRDAELLSSFLRLAFTEAVDTGSDEGLRRVVEEAGLSWDAARPLAGNDDWRDELEQNRRAMLEHGLWGVPSFHVSSPGRPDWSAWGQDRLWRLAEEIRQRAGSTA